MNSPAFASLGLGESLLSAIAAEGYITPTPIQAASIPPLLEGKDLLATAQTGTGKTAAFALPIIQLLSSRQSRPAPRSVTALVVAPTRELAAQIDASFAAYARNTRLSHACVFGGVGKSPQAKAAGRGLDVLVATPGRLLDLHSEGSLRLDHVEFVVLDEADRMLDMGFIHDVKRIFALIPERRQTMLFSATMPKDIATLAAKVLHNPVRVSVSPEKPAVELIDQKVVFVDKADKRAFLGGLIHAQEAGRAIVFTRTKHGADRLAKSLHATGIPAAAIHANKSQGHRTRTLEDFRSGSVRVLVATDLAARGIDVDGITHVYNYELPEVAETYVHRIGRTARAGASGQAVALCDAEEKPLLKAIERLLRKDVPVAAGPEYAAAFETARLARIEAAANPPAEREREERYRDPRRAMQERRASKRPAKTDRAAGPARSGERKPVRVERPSGPGQGARQRQAGARTGAPARRPEGGTRRASA